MHERVVLEDAAAVATEHGVVASTALLGGSAARTIAAYAEACDTDLIVVGCQGHRAVTGAFLGSVSLALLRGSTRRVLIVRGAGRSTTGAELGGPSQKRVNSRDRAG